MAEVAAAAIAAEQVVATGLEAAAAVAVAAPTLPLKISLTRLENPAPEGTPHPALARSQHTLTVLTNPDNSEKAYMFGGVDAQGTLCPPGIHTLTLPSPSSSSSTTTSTTSTSTPAVTTTPADAAPYTPAYTAHPPYALQDPSTGETLLPSPRAGHAACARGPGGRYLLVHGGRDGAGKAIEEGNVLWQWDTKELSWGKLRGDTQLGRGMMGRWGHWIFVEEGEDEEEGKGGGFVVLVGGKGDGGGKGGSELEREAWMYEFGAGVWTALPRVPARPLAAVYTGGRVYVISADGEGESGALGGTVHYLDMLGSATEREKPGALEWQSVSFPANPLAPGPKPRAGGALVPLKTGHGREYLVYMFGGGEGDEKSLYSDIWTLQLPSQGRSAAAAKDKIREKLPRLESGEFKWAEADIVATEQVTEEGKVHPGPRALFGADACLGGQGVVLWGGKNGKGEAEGDGWLLRLAHGYADNDRYE